MSVTVRSYDHARDYAAVNRFLIETYEPSDHLANWLQPRWEYMHHHPFIENVELAKIAVYEEGDRLVGLAHPEDKLTFIYFQRRSGFDHLIPMMLDYADEVFGGPSLMLQRNIIGLFINDFDKTLEEAAAERGYRCLDGYHEGYSKHPLDQPLAKPDLPLGFRLQSLAEENDYRRINRCLWRGFNHEGEIPPDEASVRSVAQGAPNFRKDHTIVAVEPGGSYVSYAGIWYVPENGIAYVEPVATDPDYRRMGLGAAAVVETLRRVQAEGADVAWVGSDQEFYRAIGFDKKFQRNLWAKDLD